MTRRRSSAGSGSTSSNDDRRVIPRGGASQPTPPRSSGRPAAAWPRSTANPVRPALPPLKGARITSFSTTAEGRVRSLAYTVNGKQGAVNYADMGNGEWKFQFVSTDGSKQEQTYQSRDRQVGGSPPRGGERPPRRDDQEAGPPGRGGPRPGREEPQAASSLLPATILRNGMRSSC